MGTGSAEFWQNEARSNHDSWVSATQRNTELQAEIKAKDEEIARLKKLAAYDSKADTLEHMRTLSFIMHGVVKELLHRIEIHDAGKLGEHEKPIFDEMTPKLKGSTYMSEEYKGFLKYMDTALQHHYATNRHHAEFGEGEERWKPIVGYEGHYEVSSLGDVRSVSRRVDRPGHDDKVFKEGKLLKSYKSPKGYLRIQLVKDGLYKNWMVHRLVALAFVKNPNGGLEVNHKDGNKQNNRATNLEWVNASENMQHAYDTGLKEAKYIVHCPELDITTIGATKMVKALEDKGIVVGVGSIYSAMDGESDVNGLHFDGLLIEDICRSRISWMNLVDLLEMVCDWFAATKRHADGNLLTSVEKNQSRFGYGDELKQILENTAKWLQGEKLKYVRPVKAST